MLEIRSGACEIASRKAREAAVGVDRHVVGPLTQDRVEGRNRAGEVTLLRLRGAAVEIGLEILRVEFDRGVEVGDGRIVVALHSAHVAAADIRRRRFWSQLHRSLIVGKRLVERVEAPVGVAAIDENVRIAVVDADGDARICDRAFDVALPLPEKSAVLVEGRVFGLEPDCFVVVLPRLGEVVF